MKFTSISISSLAHLKNIELDLTYQNGPRKGEPLDKICFIGQSGTGKTTILNAIEHFFNSQIHNSKDPNTHSFNEGISFTLVTDNGIGQKKENIYQLENKNTLNLLTNYFATIKKCILLYISAELIENNNTIFASNHDAPNKKSDEKILNERKKSLNFPSSRAIDYFKCIKVDKNTSQYLWDVIIENILKYDDAKAQKGKELIQKGYHTNISRMELEMKKWSNENENPRIKFSKDVLNPILNKFRLEIDLDDISTPLGIKNINDDSVFSSEHLSTGTKQFIFSILPIYKIAKQNTIILIDEPERSLFPDIQLELISFYRSIAPTCQFFISTHSPIIAASFEADERFVFYFDENDQVRVNRGVAPIGDDPNDLLKKDFHISPVMNHFGVRAYNKYLEIKTKIKNESDSAIKDELIIEATKLATEYNFEK